MARLAIPLVHRPCSIGAAKPALLAIACQNQVPASNPALVAALIVNGEGRQPVDFVAPQVDPHGTGCGRGKDVDDRAASCDLAAMLDEFFPAIATSDEGSHHGIGIELPSVAADVNPPESGFIAPWRSRT